MLGILLIYFIGRYFYRLAEKYDKSKWGFAIIGVLSYYGGLALFGLTLGVILGLVAPETLDTMNERLLGILLIPFGIGSSWGLYVFLKRRWQKESNLVVDEIDDIGKNEI
ncbi:hypothetical protein ACFQ1M_08105 [Sungkyunkwania multivorans]|uniref:Uncharacterized protein n=1 Tax=Sungkyunkwania multivorans TaxID=1173618 RepID=A0ABW3CWM8_9FLAO